MKFVDLFAGIGGFRLGLEQAGHECLAFCEIDKFAIKSYKAIHDTKGEEEFHDITAVSDESVRGLGSVDIISGGFPCQAFSIAGKRQGFDDTRGTLFFEIARFASILRPRYLFLENVKGLLNHEGGATFETILRALDELGYDVEWSVLNSKDFGVPQNRERVFIIGHLRGECTGKVFPFSRDDRTFSNSNKIIKAGNIRKNKKSQSGQIVSSAGLSPALNATDYKNPIKVVESDEIKYVEGEFIRIKEATKKGYVEAALGDSVNISHPTSETRRGRVGKKIANTLLTGEEQAVVVPVLTPDRVEKSQNGRRFKEDGDSSFTLTTQDKHGVYDGLRIRKLTPLECWRLQGFPDWAFHKAAAVNSDSQLYKQAGNSVTVPVIYDIAKRLEE